MQSIQQMIEAVLNDAQPAVLAMITHVEGSAYRKEGAWMLLQRDGVRMGVISGGCLENDLQSRSLELFNTGKVEIVQYDLSAEDDLGWGRGAGCNGVVSVLVRDIDANFRHFLTLVYKQLLAKEPVFFIQSISDFDNYACLNEDRDCLDSWQGEMPFELDAATPFQNNSGQKSIGDEMVYFQLIWPRPALYIIGAGVDARPLARLAENVGYAVHLFDWRGALCNNVHFPTAASFQIGDTEQLIADLSLSPLDSVVIMTHDFQLDMKLVRGLRESKLLYLGILGSKKRTERLLSGEIPDGVHSPVGLSIGADGPEEIAVSIVAELIEVRQGKKI